MLRFTKTIIVYPFCPLRLKALIFTIFIFSGLELTSNDSLRWQKKLSQGLYTEGNDLVLDSLINYFDKNRFHEQYIEHNFLKINFLQLYGEYTDAQKLINILRDSIKSFHKQKININYTKNTIKLELKDASQMYILDKYENSHKAYLKLRDKIEKASLDSLYKSKRINQCNKFIAAINIELERYFEALALYQIISNYSKLETPTMAMMAKLYKKLGDLKNAEKYAEKSFNANKYSLNKITQNNTYLSLLKYYISVNSTEKISKLIEYLNYNIRKDFNRFLFDRIVFNYNLEKGEHKKAYNILKEIKLLNNQTLESSILLNHEKIKYYLKTKDYNLAENQLETIFDTLRIANIEKINQANIPFNNIDLIVESLAYGLHIKNEKLSNNLNEKDLKIGKIYAEEMYNFIVGARSKIRSDLDKKFSNIQFEKHYNYLIEFAFLSQDKDLIWKYLKLSNNYSTSFSRLYRAHLQENSKVEDFEKLSKLYSEIIALEAKGAQFPDSIEISNLLIKKREEYNYGGQVEDINSSLENKMISDNTISEVQNSLGSNESIILFYTTNDIIYRAVITSNNMQIDKMPMISNIQEFISCFSDVDCNYEPTVLTLSSLLKNVDLTEKITIIPHGILNCIPFEALVDNQGNSLIFNHTINYQYSWNPEKTHTSSSSCLAIAPSFNDTCSTFLPLEYNITESDKIKSILNIKTEVDSVDILKATFFEKCLKTDILHFASHTYIDNLYPRNSYLSLGENCQRDIDSTKIFINDILTQTLSNELIVLSSCDSGNGKLVKGEGLESLSKAFFKSGVKSIISTLWSANDQSTSEIMKYFYSNLNKGKSKDESLKAAKIKFLNTYGPDYYHPYYWAGFVPFGDMSPVIENNKKRNIYILLFFSAIALIFYINKKKTLKAVA